MPKLLTAKTKQDCIRIRLDENLSTPAIAKRIGISNYSVYRILAAHPWIAPRDRDHCQITRGKRWTEADLAYLRTSYPAAAREALMVRLPGRTWEQICKVANMHGFRRKPLVLNPPKYPVHPLCQQLRRAREFKNMPRSRLQAITGISTNDLLKWETGQAQPQMRSLLKWIAGLGFELRLEPIE